MPLRRSFAMPTKTHECHGRSFLPASLERWHYLSFLKSNQTLQMLRSIRSRSLEPQKVTALLHVVENDLGFYLHQSVQATKAALSSPHFGAHH